MMTFMLYSFMAFFLSTILFMTLITFQFHSSSIFEKSLPFECGFSMIKSPRVPFSTRYFLLSVIFMVFDIELVLLFPVMSMSLHSSNFLLFSISALFFILMMGIIYEHKEGSFDWVK
uniref:NADH-ubiquinone oxidoreductase chain 3 n=1 Tax=Chaetoderma nitidulum TaxID=256131 RepID=D3G6D7_CHANT|nr:NADH dehydrogenase subunit 3 [Chaetoderma nitidulum]ABM69285.1 NADH dehydrogenase subunit 3 [Chaetoderma nitidulum]